MNRIDNETKKRLRNTGSPTHSFPRYSGEFGSTSLLSASIACCSVHCQQFRFMSKLCQSSISIPVERARVMFWYWGVLPSAGNTCYNQVVRPVLIKVGMPLTFCENLYSTVTSKVFPCWDGDSGWR